MNPPDPKRLLDDVATSDELRLGLQELQGSTADAAQLTRIVAGLSAVGVAVTAGSAQASTVSIAASAGAAQVVPTAGKVAIWKLAALALVPAGAGLVVALLPGNAERPQAVSSSSEQATPVRSPVTPVAIRESARTPGRQALAVTSAGTDVSAGNAVTDHAVEPSSPGADLPVGTSARDQGPSAPVGAASSTAPHRPQVSGDRSAPITMPHSTGAKKTDVTAPSMAVPVRSEVELLQTASTVLGGNPAEALQLCEEHRRFYPSGAMSQEREMIAVTALVRLGRQDEAYARAERFRLNYPKSAYLRQIDKVSPPR